MAATGHGSTDDNRREWREIARRRRREYRGAGRCMCGRPVAPESRSRCLACLERARRSQRRRAGKTTVRPGKRSYALLGTWAERKRAFERDERLRERRDEGNKSFGGWTLRR